MKIYTCKNKINEQIVKIFLAEKGLDVELISTRKNRGSDLSEAQGLLQEPILKLQGDYKIMGVNAICRYFDAKLKEGSPLLFGVTSKEQGTIEMWSYLITVYGLNELRRYSTTIIQPVFSLEMICCQLQRLFVLLEKQLVGKAFVCGDNLSMADIFAYVSIGYAQQLDIQMTYDFPYSQALYIRLSERPGFVLNKIS